MSDYNLTQTLNHINESNYDVDIAVDLDPNYFIAVTSNTLNEDQTERTLLVNMFILKGIAGGPSHTNSGLFVRRAHEASIKVVLMKNKQEVATQITDYP